MNNAILGPEVLLDPLGRGYADMTATEVAADMHLVNRAVDVETISAGKLQAAVVGTEYVALSAVARDAWIAILVAGDVDVSNENIRAQIAAIWVAGTVTRANLVALQTKTVDRCEELGLAFVYPGHIEQVRM